MDPEEMMRQAPEGSFLQKLLIDIYLGDGSRNPSIITRLATQEERQTQVEEAVKGIQSKIDTGFWFVLATLVSSVGALIAIVFKH